MATVETSKDLLIDALQDLAAAEGALADRLTAIVVKVSDGETSAAFDYYSHTAAARCHSLKPAIDELGGQEEGAGNLWMCAVLDDAMRDIDTIKLGRLLDIALIGALRKGAQSARVSYETAILVAEESGQDDIADRCRKAQAAHAECDAVLYSALVRLTG